MTSGDLASIIAAGGSLVTAVLALGTFIRAGHVRDDTRDIKRDVNGMSTAREVMAMRAGTAESNAAGVAAERRNPMVSAPDTGQHQSS